MTKPINLSIFFPVYNEQENIQKTILRTINVAEESPYIGEYEIIVVNDGSTDNSKQAAQALAIDHPQVRVVDHPQNLGYGAALKTGIAAARMDYVFFTDADLQFDAVELQHLLVHLDAYPVVVGYRAPRRDPLMRLLNAWVWNVLNRLFFGLKVRDIDCAFKLFKRDAIQGLKLTSSGAMISAETLIRLFRNNIPVKEVPVSHLPRTAGAATGAKFSVILRALHEMVQLYRSDLGSVSQKQAMRFMAVGIVNTLLDVLVYVVFTRGVPFFAVHLTAAKFLSFFVGTVSSLVLNRRWTFRVEGKLKIAEVVRFYAMTALSVTVNVVLMNALLNLGIYDLYALALTTGATFIANFTITKFWVFKNYSPAPLVKSYAHV